MSSKQWRISVQSSQINLDRLFPVSSTFSLLFFLHRHKYSNLRNTACWICTKPPLFFPGPPTPTTTTTTSTTTEMICVSNPVVWPGLNALRAQRTFPQLKPCQRNLFLFYSFLKSCWCQRCEVLLWFVLADWTQLLPQPCSPFTYFSSMTIRNKVWAQIYCNLSQIFILLLKLAHTLLKIFFKNRLSLFNM